MPNHTGNKDSCSTVFTAALFVTGRIWKQPRCPSKEEWYIYTVDYYSAIKHNDIMKFEANGPN